AVVVAGVGTAELRAGPGLYPGSPAPGAEGNVAIAAHRTTYGAWFRNLDRLRPGDTIRLLVGGKSYVYRVERSWTVRPDAVWVLAPTTYPALTLTTCTPPGSAAFRLVVRARLTSRP
ncbi:MAG: class E sortase, partial [Firmicutes bacterium]|nr:class E sortase [Bacillota bacterium]